MTASFRSQKKCSNVANPRSPLCCSCLRSHLWRVVGSYRSFMKLGLGFLCVGAQPVLANLSRQGNGKAAKSGNTSWACWACCGLR